MKSHIVSLMVFLASPLLTGANSSACTTSSQATERASVHGMLVLGDAGGIFLSHLPMFHSPHDQQVIWKAKFGVAAEAVLSSEKRKFPSETVYTLVPEKFVLSEMIAAPKPFKARLVRGHFERGGVTIVADLNVTLERIVYGEKLVATTPMPSDFQYLVFGNAVDVFLIHVIAGKPSFDQVLSANVSAAPAAVKQLLQGGQTLTMKVSQTLKSHSAPLAVPLLQAGGLEVGTAELSSLAELYFETGDLEI